MPFYSPADFADSSIAELSTTPFERHSHYLFPFNHPQPAAAHPLATIFYYINIC
jgi:hypothetical protein